MNESPHLTVEQLAKRWHTTPQGIYTRRHRGRAPEALEDGRKLLFPLSEVERFEAEQLARRRKARQAAMRPAEATRPASRPRVPRHTTPAAA
ncbi:DNA-binding protein [Streptomyces sp. DSM 44917]|uniref:DNA-binding protein n=1 Tax=Streptomyces boetiae TaxID=3075541 RepID=A0ABU2L3S8_9ACTN|nr:DNA-binding protein [Streptomyces sp. DSM 44917]MDT0306180.1 DNA-binding protein [Streptomyces sp. DSM 44917]